MTALKAAFEKAGVDSNQVRLEAMSRLILTCARGDMAKASMQLWMQIRSVPEFSRIVCLAYLNSLPNSGSGGGGQCCPDIQTPIASAPIPAPLPTPSAKPVLKRPPRGSVSRMSSMFDRLKTADGRVWGDVHWHELASMSRDGGIAQRLLVMYAAPATNKAVRLRDYFKEKQFSDAVLSVGS